MSEFKVSVIIPVYNAEKYVKKAVESALMQEEVGEVVLVEDKSPDNSLQLCMEMAQTDRRIHLYQHHDKQNHGAGASRNLGIEKAQFDYIAFLDADDYYLAGRFKKDKELFSSNKNIDGVYNAVGTDYYEEVENAFIPKEFITTINKNVESADLFYLLLTTESGWIHSNGVTVKKKVFEKAGMFDPSLRLGQDIHLWIRVAAVCTLIGGEVNHPVAMRGVHLQNRVSAGKMLDQYRLALLSKLLDWAVEEKLPVDKRRLLWKSYYQFRVKGLSKSRRKRFSEALVELYRYPFIWGYPEYYKIIPFLSRKKK